MSWLTNGGIDDNDFSEVKIQVYKFNLMGYAVHCILLDTQVEVMTEFFKEVSTGKVLWDDAKEITLKKLYKLEHPGLSDDKIEKVLKMNPQMFHSVSVFRDLESSVWTFGRTKKIEKRYGKHTTQKPEEIIERIVLCSSQKGDVILDLFSGSGTTGVVSVRHDRKYIGIEISEEYLQISKKRILDEVKH